MGIAERNFCAPADLPAQYCRLHIESDDAARLRHWIERPAPVQPSAGLRATIEYRAASGEITRRAITVAGFNGGPAIEAFCHLRRARRRFRLDRIACVITEDGEILDPAEVWQAAGIGPAACTETSPFEQAARVKSLLGPQLCVLASVAHAGGIPRPDACAAILTFVEASCERAGVVLDPASALRLAAHIRQLRPDRDQVDAALETLLSRRFGNPAALDADGRARLGRAVRTVTDADDEIDGAEFLAIAELQSRFGWG